jgi:hypothetical protein
VSNNGVEVFLGNPIDDPNELGLLNRLRSDVADAGMRARIHANFMAGKSQRQVDFLIVTEARLVQAELKTVDPSRPLVGGLNGPWQQLGRDGFVKHLGNYYDQAHQATYAVGDEMTKLARDGAVPRHPQDRFIKAIDSILLFSPRVPDGCELERHNHITVVGYDQLLARLATPGPRPGWSWHDWDVFARQLGLYAESIETTAERERRVTLDLAADYRHRLVAALESDLAPYVPIRAVVPGQVIGDPMSRIKPVLRSGGTVVVTGRSGDGKSHLAGHVTRELAATGMLPLLVSCGDYQVGRFPVALKRAAARFTTEPIVAFIDRASAAGVGIVLILDGMNECPADVQKDLLERLDEFRLRHPAGVMVTSSDPVAIADAAGAVPVQLPAPDLDERVAILLSHGVTPTADLLAFDNRFDLALAADVAADLPPGSPRVDFYDRFIARRTTEDQRRVLRVVASRMREEFRSSTSATEVRQLARDVDDVAATTVDGILSCGLLRVSQGRVRLIHDRIADFLTAESIALGGATVGDVVTALQDPRFAPIASFTIASLPRAEHRNEVLDALARVDLFIEALEGQFRPRVADRMAAEVRTALSEACADTDAGRVVPMTNEDDDWMLQWEVDVDRSERAFALLQVAARRFRSGQFLDEVLELIDVTDRFMAAQIQRLRDAGNRRATSAAFKALYEHGWTTRGPHQTPAASVIVGWESVVGTGTALGASNDLVARVWAPGSGSTCWGRLLLALRLIRFAPEVYPVAPQLLREAWAAIAWHLRLEVLDTAKSLAHVVEGEVRKGIVDFLNDLGRLDDVALSTILVEALAGYDELEPTSDADEIAAVIESALRAPDDPKSWEMARRVFSLRWDNERIVGPYYEVLEALPPEDRVRLATIACSGGRLPTLYPYLVIRVLTDAASPGCSERLQAVLAYHAAHLEFRSISPQDAVAAHVEAVLGWARIGSELPDLDGDDHCVSPAWRLIDEALFAIQREDGVRLAASEVRTRWQGFAHEIVGALVWLGLSQHVYLGDADPLDPLDSLRTGCPELIRDVAELVLANPDMGSDRWDGFAKNDGLPLAITQLGMVGTRDSIAFVSPYLDGAYGQQAAAAIRAIEARGT